MEIAALSSILGGSPANVETLPAQQRVAVMPKRDRQPRLTKIDRRARLGRGVAELTAMFAATVGGDQTSMRKLVDRI
jgi:hypothetical protein